MKILGIVFPGMTAIDLIGPLQALSAVPDATIMTTWQEAGSVPTDAGVPFTATHSFDDAWDVADVLIVGGAGAPTLDVMRHEGALRFIRDRAERATWIVSVCTGSLILAAAGLLNGRRAASYWAVREHLAAFGAIPDPARVVFDGNVCTGGGVTAGIDVGVALAAKLIDENFGRMLELILEYAPAPPFGTGRPELASPDHATTVKGMVDALMSSEDIKRVAQRTRELFP